MISRKITSRLEEFYNEGGKSALLIDGARQVGKTYIIEEFGRTHYESVVKIDFVKMKGAIGLFQDVEDEKEIISRISAFSQKPLIEGKTLIFLDEIQKCPEAVTYLKYLVRDDGRYHYILDNVAKSGMTHDLTPYPQRPRCAGAGKRGYCYHATQRGRCGYGTCQLRTSIHPRLCHIINFFDSCPIRFWLFSALFTSDV